MTHKLQDAANRLKESLREEGRQQAIAELAALMHDFDIQLQPVLDRCFQAYNSGDIFFSAINADPLSAVRECVRKIKEGT